MIDFLGGNYPKGLIPNTRTLCHSLPMAPASLPQERGRRAVRRADFPSQVRSARSGEPGGNTLEGQRSMQLHKFVYFFMVECTLFALVPGKTKGTATIFLGSLVFATYPILRHTLF